MARKLRRRGRVRTVLGVLLSLGWLYVWTLPVVVALTMDPAMATVVLLGIAALFIGLYVIRPLRARRRVAAHLRLRPCGRYLTWLTFAAAMKLLLVFSTLALHEELAARRMLPKLPEDADFVSAAFLADPLGQVALFLAIAVMAPLIEEFAFRGRVQHALEHAFGFVPALLSSAVIFSVLHGRIDGAHHLAFGLFTGWAVWRTGSIWTGVYMHALNNAAVQLLMHLSTDSSLEWSDVASRVWPYAIAGSALGIAGLIGAGARIHRLAELERPGHLTAFGARPLDMVASPVP